MYKLAPVLMLIACSRATHRPPSPEQKQVFLSKVSQLSPLICNVSGHEFACKDQQDGDVVVWNGLLALSGEKRFCSSLEMTVDETGRPWRGPQFYKNDNVNEFSRDSLIGLSAWVIGCGDKATWQRFKVYLTAHRTLCEHPTDNKCEISGNMRDLIKHTDRHFGISNDENVAGYSESLLVEATVNASGYPMNLVASQIFILNKTGTSNATLDLAKTKLRQRQPGNPFFNYLDKNEQAAIDLAVQQMGVNGTKSQWSFERAAKEEAWRDSMGWEWLFLANLVND